MASYSLLSDFLFAKPILSDIILLMRNVYEILVYITICWLFNRSCDDNAIQFISQVEVVVSNERER